MLQMIPGNKPIENHVQDPARSIDDLLDVLLVDPIQLHEHSEPTTARRAVLRLGGLI